MRPSAPGRPFLIIAHRGARDQAPENTLAAFDAALALGFTHIELDAQLSADGVPVVIHDETLDRTTDARGPVAGRTLSQLKGLDAGGWHGAAFRGQRIPTLEEVLLRYRAKAYLHLELKSAQPELPRAVAALLEATRWPLKESGRPGPFGWPATGVTVTSFHRAQLDRMRAILPGLPLAWLVEALTPESLNAARASRFRMVCPRADNADAPAARDALAQGFGVRAWGLKAEAELDRLVACGIEGTTCDWPGRARAYLGKRGVPVFP